MLAADSAALRARGLGCWPQRHRRTPMVGRTHGVHAEPITFGLKCLVWSEELGRDQARLARALDDCRGRQALGRGRARCAHLDPEIERRSRCERWASRPSRWPTRWCSATATRRCSAPLAVLGGTLEKIALEVRHLQRTEVREAEEPFREGQKGSSAMPHKRNPIRCERVCGLARLLRAYARAALENQALWHERDISHSSVERVILPDALPRSRTSWLAELAGVLRRSHASTLRRMRRNLDAGAAWCARSACCWP